MGQKTQSYIERIIYIQNLPVKRSRKKNAI
nr:MAG TPA: hypothetical protein [Caudoviricetes sp.]